jgi:hypothetical protein
MTDLAARIADVKQKAEAATPQNFDTAEIKTAGAFIVCPFCDGEGEVEVTADYCNYDNVAIGVQFYGVGNHFGNAEAYYRAASPDLILAMAARIEELEKVLEPFGKLNTHDQALPLDSTTVYVIAVDAPDHEWDMGHMTLGACRAAAHAVSTGEKG